MSKIFWLPLWGIGVSANSYFALRWIAGDQFLVVRLANYFLPWIGLALLICLSAALYSKKRKLSVILLAPVVIGGGPQNLDSVLSSDSDPNGRIRDEQDT